MTVKDELLVFWLCCLVLISFAVRHFLGCAADLMQTVAALGPASVPGLLPFFVGHLR